MRKTNLLLILTPHIIRDQSDLRKIFQRKMQERQEFIDRYFVFSDTNWQPPRDWSRTNGLLEEIRQTYIQVDQAQLLQQQLEQTEAPPEHKPREGIEMAETVQSGQIKQPAKPAPKRRTTPRKRRTTPRRRTPKKSSVDPAQQPAVQINPMARSVNVL